MAVFSVLLSSVLGFWAEVLAVIVLSAALGLFCFGAVFALVFFSGALGVEVVCFVLFPCDVERDLSRFWLPGVFFLLALSCWPDLLPRRAPDFDFELDVLCLSVLGFL